MEIVDFKTWVNENATQKQKGKPQSVNESKKLDLLEKAKTFNIYVENLKNGKGDWFNIYDRKGVKELRALIKKDDYEIVDIDDEYGLGSLVGKYSTIKSIIEVSRKIRNLDKTEIAIMKFLIEEDYADNISEAISKLDDVIYYEVDSFEELAKELHNNGIVDEDFMYKHGYYELDDIVAQEVLSNMGYEDENGEWIEPEFDEDEFEEEYSPEEYPEFYMLHFTSFARDLKLSGEYEEIRLKRYNNIYIKTIDL